MTQISWRDGLSVTWRHPTGRCLVFAPRSLSNKLMWTSSSALTCLSDLFKQPSDALILGKIKNVECVLLAR